MLSERTIALSNIERFSTIPVMKYRSTLVDHYRRVGSLLNSLGPVIQEYFPTYRHKLAQAIAAVHDDPELITGDVPTNIKEKMTNEEKDELENRERVAIVELQRYHSPISDSRLYGWLMLQAQLKSSIEAQIVSVTDKIDGFGEAFREVYAGNTFFIAAADEYITRVNSLPMKFPKLRPIFEESKHPLLQPVPPIDIVTILRNRHQHQRRLTGICVYDEWYRITE